MAFKDWLRGTWQKVKTWLAYNPSKVPKLPPPKVVTLPQPTTVPKPWAAAGTPIDPGLPAPKKAALQKPKPIDPWATGHLLKLSPEELRARAMKIQPWKTEWIGRVDVIPPQTDERTALIDRGRVLPGFFTEQALPASHHSGAVQCHRGLVDELPDVLVVALDELPDVHTHHSLGCTFQPAPVVAVPMRSRSRFGCPPLGRSGNSRRDGLASSDDEASGLPLQSDRNTRR